MVGIMDMTLDHVIKPNEMRQNHQWLAHLCQEMVSLRGQMAKLMDHMIGQRFNLVYVLEFL